MNSDVEVSGERVGVGRLQNIGSGTAELGGMYVDDRFRGAGLAASIVEFLIENSGEYKKIYCLPFSHLSKILYATRLQSGR